MFAFVQFPHGQYNLVRKCPSENSLRKLLICLLKFSSLCARFVPRNVDLSFLVDLIYTLNNSAALPCE